MRYRNKIGTIFIALLLSVVCSYAQNLEIIGLPTDCKESISSITPISKPDDNKCGIYEYQYTVANQCDSLTASITFEVENCDTTVCEDNDIVVIDGKPGYTLEDLEVLRGYVQNGATLQPASDGGYTITIQTDCGTTTYTLNSCFLDNADLNKDGVVNNADIDRLAEVILEQTNCQNN